MAENTPHGETGEEPTDWKSLARKWENRAKSANEKVRDLQTQLAEADQEHEAAVKAAVAPLETRISEFEHAEKVRGWKHAAAKEHGVPEALLRGGSEDEINAHATELHDAFQARTAPVVAGVEQAPAAGASDERQFVRELFAQPAGH